MSEKFVISFFWLTVVILSFLSFRNYMLNLNTFVLFGQLLFYSFSHYKRVKMSNLFHISWMSLCLSAALYITDFTMQILLIGVLPLSLIFKSWQRKGMKYFAFFQLTALVLLFGGATIYHVSEHEVAIVIILNALLIRQIQFPFHIWIRELKENLDLYPSFLFFIILQSGFVIYTQDYIQDHHTSLMFSLIPAITLLTGILMAVSALREKNSLIQHLLIIISQSCLPLAAYHSFNTISATGGIMFSVLLAISGGVFALLAFQIYIQKGILELDRNYSLYRKNKNLGIIYLVSGLSIVGFPLSMGFFAEDILFHGLIESAPFFAVIYIGVTAINAYTVFRTFNILFLGHSKDRWTPTYLSSANRLFLGLAFMMITGSVFFVGPISSTIHKKLDKVNRYDWQNQKS